MTYTVKLKMQQELLDTLEQSAANNKRSVSKEVDHILSLGIIPLRQAVTYGGVMRSVRLSEETKGTGGKRIVNIINQYFKVSV